MDQRILNAKPHRVDTNPSSDDWPVGDAQAIARDCPDAHWSLVEEKENVGETVVARCSLWWQDTPAHGAHRVGAIGHWAVDSADAAANMLSLACDELRAHGCTLAVGPMDGNTWRSYRLVTDYGDEPPFLFEPSNPPDWPDHFRNHGFFAFAEYFSALDDDLGRPDPLLARAAQQMESHGIRIRKLKHRHFEQDLLKIHSVASIIFRNNLLFAPIDAATFVEFYRPLKELVNHDFVLLAERGRQPVGFLFAIPDFSQAERGETMDTLVVKTLAVLPDQQYAGLGYLMLHQTRLTVYQLGYTRLIKAMVRDTASLRRSAFKNARRIRTYTLFAKELRP